MSNASQAFRSSLMQQFVASARQQARTPIALIGWVDNESDSTSNHGSHQRQSQRHRQRQRRSSTSSSMVRPPSSTTATTNNPVVLSSPPRVVRTQTPMISVATKAPPPVVTLESAAAVAAAAAVSIAAEKSQNQPIHLVPHPATDNLPTKVTTNSGPTTSLPILPMAVTTLESAQAAAAKNASSSKDSSARMATEHPTLDTLSLSGNSNRLVAAAASSSFSSTSLRRRDNLGNSIAISMNESALVSTSSSIRLHNLSTAAFLENENADGQRDEMNEPTLTLQAQAFQRMIQTRRTASVRVSSSPNTDSFSHFDHIDYYKAALDRAVLSGMAAPNHKRTEPFTFKRILGPSDTTLQLADIARQVYLHSPKHGLPFDSNVLQAEAMRKRDKWLQIPAFLVTLVSSSSSRDSDRRRHRSSRMPHKAAVTTPTMENDVALVKEDDVDTMAHDAATTSTGTLHYPYTALPFVPPTTERELEDYAAACAATQNVLLSLHAEHVECKWATGSVIYTPAFRTLIQAQPSDRVVALVQIIGYNSNNTNSNTQQRQDDKTRSTSGRQNDTGIPPRWHRRALYGDVLLDL